MPSSSFSARGLCFRRPQLKGRRRHQGSAARLQHQHSPLRHSQQITFLLHFFLSLFIYLLKKRGNRPRGMNWPRAVLLLSAAASTCLPRPLPSPGLPPGQFPCKRRDLSLHHCLQTQPNFTARGSPGKFASPFSEAQKEDCTAPTPQSCREGFNSCKRRRLIAWHQDALEARSHTNAGFLQIYAT